MFLSRRQETLAQEHFKEKAIQAMFALRKYTEVDRLPLKTAHKLFDTLIAPILTTAVQYGMHT